jgi:hypothetical protein
MSSLIRKQGNWNYKSNHQGLCETPEFIVQEKEKVAEIKSKLEEYHHLGYDAV